MKGIIASLVVLALVIALVFTKCSVPNVESQIDRNDPIQLVQVYNLGYNDIFMDRDTHVLYMDKGYATFPLLDADGTARTYEEVDWGN